jgi:hypothetical protein
VIRVWAWGSTRSAAGRDIHFSIEATDDPLVGTTGTFFVVDTAIDTTFLGSIDGGHFTHQANGSGTAPMTGFLARGTPATFVLTDANAADNLDTFEMHVPGLIDFKGNVIHGDIRVALAVRPPEKEPSNFAPPDGFAFDSQIGLFVSDADTGDKHILGHQIPIPEPVLQTTRPEPVMDYQRNRLGGVLTSAGDDDNTLDAIPGVKPMIKNLTDYVLEQ